MAVAACKYAVGSPFPAGDQQPCAGCHRLCISTIDSCNPDLNRHPAISRDITNPAENAVSVLLGDGHGGFRPMSGSPLPLSGCQRPQQCRRWRFLTGRWNKICRGHLRGEPNDAHLRQPVVKIGSIYFDNFFYRWWPLGHPLLLARLTADRRSAILTANADAGFHHDLLSPD